MKNNKKSATRLRYFIIPVLIILIIISVVNFFIYQRELVFFRNIYDNEVIGTESLLDRRIQSALSAAESVKALFLASDNVGKEEFDIFALALTKSLGSGALNLSLTIEWVDEQNNIRYIYPLDEINKKIIGLDLNKYPNRLLPIIKAKTTKASVVTEPIMLAQGYPGLLIYSPIFKGDSYLGEAVIVIRLANLLNPIPGDHSLYHKDTNLKTGNFIIPFDDDMIFSNTGERIINPEGELVKDPIAQEYLNSSREAESRDIIFADKIWQLKIFPTYIEEVTKRTIIYFSVSLFFALSIIIFLWILQKQREQLLREKAKAEALILSIGDGLVACDIKGIITFANKKAEELSGYSSKESIGVAYQDVWHIVDEKGVDIPEKASLFYQAITKKEIVTSSIGEHLYIVKKDGTRFPLAATVAPVGVNGQIDGMIAVFRDITKDSEVDRMKTEFLSLVSHQLLTPSSAIKWIVDLLLKGDYGVLNEKQLEGLRNIYNSNEDMIALVNSLLNISRIESGRLTVTPKLTSLNDLVNEVQKELANRIAKKEQVFSFKTEGKLLPINIDPHLIKEVYKNLLTNAIKYTPAKGHISITISQVKNYLVSKVIDDGYGIPAKEQNKVFKKFYRGSNITSIEKDGNGLGLYLVKQIIDVSGGKIGLTSEVDRGTTFWFSLPVSGSKAKAGQVTIS